MSTFQYPKRSELMDGGRSGRSADIGADAASEAVPEIGSEGVDASEMEHVCLVSVDDLDYLHASLQEMADLLGVTAKGLRQLGVSPEEAAGTCAALERMHRELNAVVFAVYRL